ncbi:hypothetical protein N658DRAFT_417269 [Parathielavia hyrcaniae]|uniref:N-acetyltransferase domain-containing protein n=1 Tax=Parathielavia hyrcaniae TaxID=113614 RepID=A0AAN6Q8G1_9PEZI|nr:hypothetical protein N658DRAFT_417269 [Parathielavia hyrcaniae]
MTPNITIEDTPTPSGPLLGLLKSHLPHSLPVLRRLQFALNFPGGRTPQTHVLYAHYPRNDTDDDDHHHHHFAAGCLDLSRGPETQLWIYSSLERTVNNNNNHRLKSNSLFIENGYSLKPEIEDEEEAKKGERAPVAPVLALLRRIKTIAATTRNINSYHDNNITTHTRDNDTYQPMEGDGTNTLLIGSLHETVRRALLARGIRLSKAPDVGPELDWELCGKWLFRVEDLPPTGIPLPAGGGPSSWGGLPKEGMRWDRVREGDAGVVLARTNVGRKELDDGTPVAWAFLGDDTMQTPGLDGTIITLHVEEEYRQRGLAKALACKLMRERLQEYGDDGWGAADVFVENSKSQALCRSIGGKNSWTLSW